jgi:hypothetical protein
LVPAQVAAEHVPSRHPDLYPSLGRTAGTVRGLPQCRPPSRSDWTVDVLVSPTPVTTPPRFTRRLSQAGGGARLAAPRLGSPSPRPEPAPRLVSPAIRWPLWIRPPDGCRLPRSRVRGGKGASSSRSLMRPHPARLGWHRADRGARQTAFSHLPPAGAALRPRGFSHADTFHLALPGGGNCFLRGKGPAGRALGTRPPAGHSPRAISLAAPRWQPIGTDRCEQTDIKTWGMAMRKLVREGTGRNGRLCPLIKLLHHQMTIWPAITINIEVEWKR